MVEYTSTPVKKDGELLGAVVVFNDITKRKREQDEIRKIYTENQLILQSAGEGVYGLCCEGKTTFVNPAAANMLGYEVEELKGQPMHALLHHTHADGSEYRNTDCPIYAAFKDGSVHHVEDEVFWRKDGSSFPVEYTSTPIRQDGKLLGAVVVFNDITERKQAEQELKQAYEEVEKMKQRLEAENTYLQEEIRTKHNFKEIVGQSYAIKQVLNQIELVAPTMANVLIIGESGTGKELIARAIHDRSERSDRPLIRVNCAAIPHELFESEFFGHMRGSFTGAIKNRTGRFELADGGTIFLDEVGEIPIDLQSKLLRVLQEGQFERVGDETTRTVDVRIIAATNRDLRKEVEKGNFREDLYFRLNVFPVEAVPLRDRLDDIPLLAEHFIELICNRINRESPKLTNANVKQLQTYAWGGNIRELQNVIERAIIVGKGNRLIFNLPKNKNEHIDAVQDTVNIADSGLPYNEIERLARDKVNIIAALRYTKGKISGAEGAAELLGIKPTTLASRMKSLEIDKRDI
ncbi:MAG: histidine kinase [endosymbiont of Galathealinum brachiosum]|uniref:Histidine kinase n=1 Tax=endosymbiont of Galathealinum brachiosum TaxID=2200906 RepID=A0A370DMN0_9GAMM|nr:MAG: histidine kinase [endosymbiont of Galathealinum brachiosum]